MRKKLLSIFIAAVMILAMVPATAFAAAEPVANVEIDGITTTYNSAGDAWNAAISASEATLTVYSDFGTDSTYVVPTGCTIILDLSNSYTAWTTSSSNSVFVVNGNLTIKNSSSAGIYTSSSTVDAVIVVNDGGELELESVTVTNNSVGGILVKDGGTATLTDCTVTNNDAYGIKVEDGGELTLDTVEVTSNDGGGLVIAGTAEITGSNITGNYALFTSEVPGITVENGGEVTISDSTVSGQDVSEGILVESGGTLTLDTVTVTGNNWGISISGDAEIKSSTVTSNLADGILLKTGGTLAISGETTVQSNASGGIEVQSGTEFNISGLLKVTGNGSSYHGNVYLKSDALITLVELESGSSIGVTTEDDPTNNAVQITTAETNTTYYQEAVDEGYITSDGGYEVVANDTGKYVQLGRSAATYTVTWLDGDGNTLDTETYNYGDTPSYTGSTPTKTATAQYTYTYDGGWTPTIVAVTEDATYTATFTEATNQYTVTFNSNGGSSVSSQTIEYGKTIDEPSSPTKSEYTFSGWYSDADLTDKWNFSSDTVTETTTLYAKWTKKSSSSGGSSYSLDETTGSSSSDDDDDNTTSTTPSADTSSIFKDLSTSHTYYDAIMKAYGLGYMVGISEDTFAADGYLTRGMAAQILWNLAGNPEPENVAPFLDVTSDAWYAKAVAWAYEQGLIIGYDYIHFGPNDYVTTEQFNIMLAKYKGEVAPAYTGDSPYATRGWVAYMITAE
ncbi:MAG: InlB B-repeat-containing protein [Clostridiales bacterium]|nr:InlB B-repeat-containing protein [Clostridiales bacterium]